MKAVNTNFDAFGLTVVEIEPVSTVTIYPSVNRIMTINSILL